MLTNDRTHTHSIEAKFHASFETIGKIECLLSSIQWRTIIIEVNVELMRKQTQPNKIGSVSYVPRRRTVDVFIYALCDAVR